ncbi:MAG: SRPBCC domain-containing protein [Planctomycetes bacterium]|nr:SRPBCC domain-containing protein [Planctomycetota bacterium]
MTTKILSPRYLCLEREVKGELFAVWRALTDLHELRAWWGAPVAGLTADVGGGFDLRFVGNARLDRFEYSVWDRGWRVGGEWSFNWHTGRVQELIILTDLGGKVRVAIEQAGFESFGDDAVRVFGHHRRETGTRLERLQQWCERRVPATLAVAPGE